MFLFWDIITRPFFQALKPRVVVEVGADIGANTTLIAGYCAETGAVCHSIDPAPSFDVEELANRFAGSLKFHQDLSLDVLPSIERADVVLLDGDHNWYTVYHELKAIEGAVRGHDNHFPVLLLHDMEWPYARRDLYYNPTTIPAEYRQPYAQKGMVKGAVNLVDTGGLNSNLNNALREGGPRNGVRNAVEDFIEESSLDLMLTVLPVCFGLGVLATKEKIADSPELKDLLDHYETRTGVSELLAFSEGNLGTTFAQVQRLQAALDVASANPGRTLLVRLSRFVRQVVARVAGVGGRMPEPPGLPSLTLSPAPATQPDMDQ